MGDGTLCGTWCTLQWIRMSLIFRRLWIFDYCWQMFFCCFQAVWSVGETCPVDAPASIERDNEFIARVVYRLPEQENVDAGTIKRLLQAVKNDNLQRFLVY